MKFCAWRSGSYVCTVCGWTVFQKRKTVQRCVESVETCPDFKLSCACFICAPSQVHAACFFLLSTLTSVIPQSKDHFRRNFDGIFKATSIDKMIRLELRREDWYLLITNLGTLYTMYSSHDNCMEESASTAQRIEIFSSDSTRFLLTV